MERKPFPKELFDRSVYRSGGSGFNEHNDCAVRSLSTADCISYEAAHSMFKKHGRKDRHCTPHKVIDTLMREEYELFPRPFHGTISKFLVDHPVGHYVVHVSEHLFAVCDGVVHDWDYHPKRRVKWFFKLV